MADAKSPQFTEGSIMRHVVVMSFTSSIGIMAIYVVDLFDIFFISLLGIEEMTAAAGYASTVLFFVSTVNIGFSVAAGILVARALGACREGEARQITTSAAAIAAAVGICAAFVLIPLLDYPLTWLGARADTIVMAKSYMAIILPATFLSGISMVLVAALRSNGDAKWAMYPALAGAGVNLLCDPLFIFGFGWGLEGAALATVMARLVTCAVALHAATYRHKALARLRLAAVRSHFHDIMYYAVPSVLTSVANPIGQAIVLRFMGKFGIEAVAAVAIIGRLTPVVFSVVNALSGAIGPIIGQNAGAGLMQRVRACYTAGLQFLAIYVIVAVIVLILLRGTIADVFNARGLTRDLLYLFCGPVGLVVFFVGSIFVSGATFNNLGHPTYSWKLNWARNTIGLLAFLSAGATLGGAFGVLYGMAANVVFFAAIANGLAIRLIARSEIVVKPTEEKMAMEEEIEQALQHQRNPSVYT